MDDHGIENPAGSIGIGGANWLFTGSRRADQRAAAMMSVVQPALMHGHAPCAYLKNVLTWLRPAGSRACCHIAEIQRMLDS